MDPKEVMPPSNKKQLDKPPNGRALGPVGDLEAFVPEEWWRSLFNHIYLKTDSDVIDDEQITSREVDMLLEILKPSQSAVILDLCCGQGRHTLEFAQRGYMNIQGLDRSRYLINRARQSAKTKSLSIRFKEGDARKLPYPNDSFDLVMILGNSFGYFASMEDDQRVVEEVHRVLKPSGMLALDITDGEYMRTHYEPRSWEWVDKHRMVCRERSLSLDQQRLITREIVVHQSRGTVVDQFYAERLYSPEMLEKLLKKAGFVGMATNLTFKGNSTRDQDLGMMGQRFLLTGKVRKEWSPVRTPSGTQARRVTVVMGDPSMKDLLKPSQIFDEDDYFTIDQLKSALRDFASDEYEFRYLNNHQTLLHDLQRDRPELVLNLCDEGYRNDPRMELHIPAILETLGIPYTGGTPQCLAACYDKALVRGVAKDLGIPVPMGFLVNPDETAFPLPEQFPVILKPTMGDSSHGIYASNVVHNANDFSDVVNKLQRAYRVPVLVEEFLTGEDLTVGIIGNLADEYQIFPIGATDYSGLPDGLPPLCGYESKWFPDSPYWTQLKFVPANLPDEIQRKIIDWSLLLKERFECNDYVRMDWRCDLQGEPRLLEINPNPGWCWDGHLNLMAQFWGITYADMLKMILRAAEARYQMAPPARSVGVHESTFEGIQSRSLGA